MLDAREKSAWRTSGGAAAAPRRKDEFTSHGMPMSVGRWPAIGTFYAELRDEPKWQFLQWPNGGLAGSRRERADFCCGRWHTPCSLRDRLTAGDWYYIM